jgi:PIN domain nuclease of toxin-antitoxin system
VSWLLDTHVFLWLAGEPSRLGPAFKRRLRESSPPLLLSAASAWELTIKVHAGKLRLPEPPATFLESRMSAGRLNEVSISIRHGIVAGELPPIHRDPFDRMIAAQALNEGWVVVTADPVFAGYGCQVLDPR